MQGNFWGCPRESASAVEARSERTLQFRVGTRSARAKWVRAKVRMSAQNDTSRSDRAAPQSGAAGGGGKNPRREAAKSEGAGTEKLADLPLFRIQKLI